MASDLKNKFLYQLLIAASQVLVPVISYPYITRILGPENLGRINYIDFLSQIFIIIASFGIPFYGIREIARVKNDKVKRSVLIKEMLVLQSIFSAASILIFILLTKNNWTGNTILYVLAMINILLSAFSCDWYIQGMEEFRFAAIRTLFVKIGIVISFFIFIKAPNDYPYYLAIFTAGFFVTSIQNIHKVLKENTFTQQPLNYKQHLKPLWHFFLTTSGISIYIYFDTVLLQHFTHSNASVGYYTTALKLVKICQLALLAVGTVLMPRMSYLAGLGHTIEIKRQLDKLLMLIITFGAPVCAGILVLAPEIIHVITGDKFLSSVGLIRILALLPLLIGLSNIFCFQILVPFKKESQFLLAVFIGCLVSITSNILLIPTLRETGAAYANIITEFIITIITGIFAYRIIKFSAAAKTIIQTVFCSLLFIPFVLLVKNIAASPFTIFFTALPGCVLLYFMLQFFVFKNEVIKEMTHYVLNIFTAKNKMPDET